MKSLSKMVNPISKTNHSSPLRLSQSASVRSMQDMHMEKAQGSQCMTPFSPTSFSSLQPWQLNLLLA